MMCKSVVRELAKVPEQIQAVQQCSTIAEDRTFRFTAGPETNSIDTLFTDEQTTEHQ